LTNHFHTVKIVCMTDKEYDAEVCRWQLHMGVRVQNLDQ
jgi:hypothetical protein